MSAAVRLGFIPTDADRAAREQRHAERVARLRDQHPHLREGYWDSLAERVRFQWRIDDMNKAINFLVGYYGERAERTGNADLAEMVATLTEAVDTIQEQTNG